MDIGDAIDGDGGPVEERRLVHRGLAVLEREEEMVVLDHILDEDGFDGFIAGAYVGGAEAMEHQRGGDDRDGEDGGEGRLRSC